MDRYNLGSLATNNYYETEMTCGTWIDGRPIFRKVIKLPSVTKGNTDVGIDLESMNFDFPVSYTGIIEWTVNDLPYKQIAPYYSSSSNYFLLQFNVSNNQVKANAGQNCSATIILEYVKKEEGAVNA